MAALGKGRGHAPQVTPVPGMAPIQGPLGPLSGIGTVAAPPGVNGIPAGTPLSPAGLAGPQGPPPAATTPAPATNGLADYANSDLGRAMSTMYGPSSMANYQGAFQGAINAARGNIADQLHGALSDIANSQAQAGVALGQYAPMVNTAWKEGQGEIANAQTAGAGAFAKYGIDPGLAQANLAPEAIAMQGTHQSDLADQALLNTGISQQGAHERAMANLAANDRYGQLDQANMGLQAQLAAASMGNDQAMNMARFNQAASGVNALRDYTLQQKLGQTPAANNNQAAGMYQNTGLTQGQVDAAQASPDFANNVKAIQNQTLKQNDVYRLQQKYPQLYQVLLANYGIKDPKTGNVGLQTWGK